MLFSFRYYFYIKTLFCQEQNDKVNFVDKPTKPNLEPLVSLLHYRWALPILAELYRSNGCKFVTLVTRLSLSKDALSRTLTALLEQDLVMRNPGYGHPLRPEYILTARGQQIGQAAFELMQTLERLGISNIALKKWSLPIVLVLQDQTRFTDLLENLPGLTTRALALSLGQLTQVNLLEPFEGISGSRNGYRLSFIGQELGSKITSLASVLSTNKMPARAATPKSIST
jgi:DNA-binding HxlR family transcriptional regulator